MTFSVGNEEKETLEALLKEELEAVENEKKEGLSFSLTPEVDLRTLLSEMVALKSEIRVETKASREMRDTLQSSLSHLEDSLARSKQREQKLEEDLTRQKANASKRMALSMIDHLDRLERALVQAKELTKPQKRWWFRFSPSPQALSLYEGLLLSVQRLHQKLDELDVYPLDSLDQEFDPEKMEALETRKADGVAEGLVLEEITKGYRLGKDILRTAQVVVSSGTNS